MGKLEYNSSHPAIEIDDDTLAHVKILIATKLRRQESFMMTWLPLGDGPDRRASVWIHPAIPLRFGFDTAEHTAIDTHRVAEMMHALNSSGELILDHLLPLD